MKALAANNPLGIRHAVDSTAQTVLSRHRKHWGNLNWLLVGSACVGGLLFYRALFGMIVADHDVHVRFVQRGVEEGVWPAHFLFQAIVYALSGFSHEFVSLAWASLVLLTTCVVAKAWLSYALLVRRCPRLPTPPFEYRARLSHSTVLALVTAALLLSAPIVRPWWTHRIYLGQISPNIWHNPTSVLCFPLVILLFFAADYFLRSGRTRELVAVGSLAFVSVLAKPNYFLAFAPVYALLAWRRFGVSRLWLLSQAAMIPTVLLLCWQLTASFGGPNAMRPGLHIAWMPLAAWQVHSNSIGLSLLFSLAFPLSYLVIFRRRLQSPQTLLLAWGVMLASLVWAGCFAEVRDADGAVDLHFNFSWGAHLSLFVLFLVTAMDMVQNRPATFVIDRHWLAAHTARLPWWLLGTHAASGILWIARQAMGRGYY
jgi:hypothetical protein